MSSFINRETLRKDILSYGVCMYRPTLLSREKVLTVIDNIPEDIVRCRNCVHRKDCDHSQRLGKDGYCSEGEIA